MTTRSVPDPWSDLLIKAGFVDTRAGKRSGSPSMRRLADEAGTTASTISAMMHGDRDTRPEVVTQVADALAREMKLTNEADVRRLHHQVNELVGRAMSRPFQAHPDADLLDPEEQDAINEVIRLWALSKKRRGGADGSVAIVPATPNDDGMSGLDDSDQDAIRELRERRKAEAVRRQQQLRKAARAGESEGRAKRDQQDDEATRPDEPGHSEGA